MKNEKPPPAPGQRTWNKRWIPALAALTLACGVAAYMQDGKSFPKAVINAFPLFAFHAKETTADLLLFDLARVAAALFHFSWFAFAYERFNTKLDELRVQRMNGPVTFVGFGATNEAISVSVLQQAPRRCAALDIDDGNPRFAHFRELGGVPLVGDGTKKFDLLRAGIKTAAQVFINTSRDTIDAAVRTQIERIALTRSTPLRSTTVLNDPYLAQIYALRTLRNQLPNLRESFVSDEWLAAEALVGHPQFQALLTQQQGTRP